MRQWLQKIRTPLLFAMARKRYYKQSRLCFFPAQIRRMQYDYILVGSDEVWNYADRKSRSRLKFGWGLAGAKLIAYAPSIGESSTAHPPDYVCRGIKKFSCLSARDERTERLIKERAGRMAVRALDPTLLTRIPTAAMEGIQKPYILFYYCERLPKEIREAVFKYAREHNIAIYGAGEYDKRYHALRSVPTPFQWAGLFCEASCVFTGTFHGTVFSILNQRPFFVYLTKSNRIEKVRSLLKDLGISGRELGEDPSALFNCPPIAYDQVFLRLKELQRQSLEYLENSMKGGEK